MSVCCPICKKPMKYKGPEGWDKEKGQYRIKNYECEKCFVSAISKVGILTYYDKEGKVILSGE